MERRDDDKLLIGGASLAACFAAISALASHRPPSVPVQVR